MPKHIRGRATPKWRICARPFRVGPKSLLPFGRSDLKRSTGPFAGLVPEPVLTVEKARKGASPSLRFSHRAFAAQWRHGAPANAALGKSACSCRKTGVHFSGACACQERFWTQRSSLLNPNHDLGRVLCALWAELCAARKKHRSMAPSAPERAPAGQAAPAEPMNEVNPA